jgi:hypothetical protein
MRKIITRIYFSSGTISKYEMVIKLVVGIKIADLVIIRILVFQEE